MLKWKVQGAGSITACLSPLDHDKLATSWTRATALERNATGTVALCGDEHSCSGEKCEDFHMRYEGCLMRISRWWSGRVGKGGLWPLSGPGMHGT